MRVALAGNPNTGKSTVFNVLTGRRQSVGNWPGKTIEKKTGVLKLGKQRIEVVDLPGTYGLTAYSIDELIARNFLVEEKPEAVINVVDASNLERNLYLTVQLMELGAKVVIALNMMDVAEGRGFRIDAKKLSELLGVPVVPTVASKNRGIKDLVSETIIVVKGKGTGGGFRIDYGKTLEPKIDELEKHIGMHASGLAKKYGARWLAVKLIEKDLEIIGKIRKADSDIYDREFEQFIRNAEEIYGENADVEIADRRYGFINGVVKTCVKRTSAAKILLSDQIDAVLTNRYFGVPFFLFIMYIVYQLVFLLGAPFVSLFGLLVESLGGLAGGLLASSGSPAWVSSLIVGGVIGGVGNVLVFAPNIALLFLSIAILEDSGYMARAAFVMNGIMGRIGMHGRSFISIVIGFGCNVPGVMSARTLSKERERLITILTNFLVPCSARMTVFVFLAGAFFAPKVAAQVIWSLVLLALLLVVAVGWTLNRFLPVGERAPFVMELPPYQVPTAKGVLLHTWDRVKSFVGKAGRFILLASVLVWFLASFPEGVEYGSGESYIGLLGRALAPLFSPLGFDWRAIVALVMGFFAKEVIISSFGVIYSVPGETLASSLAKAWTPLQALAFMVFTLIYTPCLATIATIKQETNSWRWTLFAVGYGLVLAWLMAFLVIQAGAALGY